MEGQDVERYVSVSLVGPEHETSLTYKELTFSSSLLR